MALKKSKMSPEKKIHIQLKLNTEKKNVLKGTRITRPYRWIISLKKNIQFSFKNVSLKKKFKNIAILGCSLADSPAKKMIFFHSP